MTKNRKAILSATVTILAVFTNVLNCSVAQGVSLSLEPGFDFSDAGDYTAVTSDVEGTDIFFNKKGVDLFEACDNQNSTNKKKTRINLRHAKSFSCKYKPENSETNKIDWVHADQALYSVGTDALKKPAGSYKFDGEYIELYSISTNKKPVAEDLDGNIYDMYMKIDNIRYRISDNKNSTDPDNAITILYGYDSGTTDFSAFQYVGGFADHMGIKFDVEIKLIKHGTGNVNTGEIIDDGKKMLWAFQDIDILDYSCADRDGFGGVYEKYHESTGEGDIDCSYAEHFKPIHGLVDGKIAVVKDTKKDGKVVKQHNLKIDGTNNDVVASDRYDGTNSNDTNVLFRVKPSGFKFEWGGSNCGTQIVDAPGIKYTRESSVKYNGTTVRNNSVQEVNGSNSKKVTFVHKIHKEGAGRMNENYYNSDKEEFYLTYGGDGVTTTTIDDFQYDPIGKQLSDGGNLVGLHTFKNNGEKNKTVVLQAKNMDPDTYASYWSNLHFVRSNLVKQPTKTDHPAGRYQTTPNSPLDSENGSCHSEHTSRVCATVYRPPAFFDGEVTPSATTDTGAASEANGYALQTNDGNYTVTFTHSITRDDSHTRNEDCHRAKCSAYHGAGDNSPIDTSYRIWYTEEHQTAGMDAVTHQNYYMNTINFKTDVTAGLKNKAQFNITPNKITGHIDAGVTVTYCEYMEYTYRRNTGSTTRVTPRCVTIYRPEKKCALDNKYGYGVNTGQNIGRVSASNRTNGQLRQSNTQGYKNGAYSEAAEAIWAKPGDEVQFIYEMCAGAFYTLQARENNRKDPAGKVEVGLSKNELGVHYGASGAIFQNVNVSKNPNITTDGYLFYSDVSIIDGHYYNPTGLGTHDSRYADVEFINPALTGLRWSIGRAGNRLMPASYSTQFLTSRDIELENKTEYVTTSPRAQEAGSRYHQTTITGVSPDNNFYQINGDVSKNSYLNNTVDVGGTIVQEMHWNDFNIRGVNRSYSYNEATKQYELSGISISNTTNTAPGTRQASASVKVPYNYTLQPYVENKDSLVGNAGVVYLGGTTHMTAGVGVMARSNATVWNQAYATITKDTNYTVSYQYRTSNDVAKTDWAVYKADHQRFNTASNLSSHSEVITTGLDNGNVYIDIPDNGSLAVGDKICIRLSVNPADSHNGSSAAGAGPGDIALYETGNNNKEIVSCSVIAKTPNMSVESSNVFSKNGYNVRRYSKYINDGAVSDKFIFGSWAEYGVFGKVTNFDTHLASGASLGYAWGTSNYDGQGAATEAGAIPNKSRSNTSDGKVPTVNNAGIRTCVYATQTIANSNCDEDNKNNLSALFGEGAVSQYKRKLEDRYKKDGVTIGSVHSYNYGSFSGLNGFYLPHNVYESRATTYPDSPVIIKLDRNGVTSGKPFYIGDSTFKVDSSQLQGKTFDHTLVINAGGLDLIIDKDIDLNKENHANISDVYNVIIFAKNVWITDKPTHIDATIIADEVNTCKYDNGTEIKKVSDLNANRCNKQLIFDAPVITKKLILNRTYGANSGNESVKRAEIFNLNMANYLWSFDQMTRYSQAITTYSRELPPRY